MAYVTMTKDNKITSFLMLKEEDENEDYSTFEKQESLIYLLKQYGFSLFTHKNTHKSNNKIEREAIYVKNIKDKR